MAKAETAHPAEMGASVVKMDSFAGGGVDDAAVMTRNWLTFAAMVRRSFRSPLFCATCIRYATAT